MDQFLSYYGFGRRTFKWWRKAFFSLLDVAVVNSYILYTLSEQDGKKLSHLNFRIRLAKELLHEAFQSLAPSSSHSSSSSSAESSSSSSDLRNRLSQSSLPPNSRLTGRHFPDKVPPRPNGNPGQRDCVVCSGKKGRGRRTTTYCCKECGVGLCVVPCFQLYHTKSDPQRYLPPIS